MNNFNNKQSFTMLNIFKHRFLFLPFLTHFLHFKWVFLVKGGWKCCKEILFKVENKQLNLFPKRKEVETLEVQQNTLEIRTKQSETK